MPSQYIRNGVKLKTYEEGYRSGYMKAKKEVVDTVLADDMPVIYSMLCVTLAEDYGWTTEQIETLLNLTQERWLNWSATAENRSPTAAKELCLEKSGIDMFYAGTRKAGSE